MAGILGTIKAFSDGLINKGYALMDQVFPPEKRSEVLARLQAFAVNNPKLSAFLLAQVALTGFPLVLFATFTITVFIFSLVVALLIGVLAALLFTAFMVGTALLVILPTIFITTFAASFLWIWAMGGFYIVKWFNNSEGPAEPGNAIGDKLNKLTGGTMNSFLMEPMRQKENDKQYEDNEKVVHGGIGNNQAGSNGGAKHPDAADAKKNANGPKKLADGATNHADGAKTKSAVAGGAAKGAAGGTTGLT